MAVNQQTTSVPSKNRLDWSYHHENAQLVPFDSAYGSSRLVRTTLGTYVFHRAEYWQAEMSLPGFGRRHTTHHFSTVGNRLLAVNSTLKQVKHAANTEAILKWQLRVPILLSPTFPIISDACGCVVSRWTVSSILDIRASRVTRWYVTAAQETSGMYVYSAASPFFASFSELHGTMLRIYLSPERQTSIQNLMNFMQKGSHIVYFMLITTSTSVIQRSKRCQFLQMYMKLLPVYFFILKNNTIQRLH